MVPEVPSVLDFAGLINAVGSYVTAAIDWMGDFASEIPDHSILVLGIVAVPLVGVGASLLGKLLRKRV